MHAQQQPRCGAGCWAPAPLWLKEGGAVKEEECSLKTCGLHHAEGSGAGGILTHGGDVGRGGWVQPFLSEPGTWDPLHRGSHHSRTSAFTQHPIMPHKEIPPHHYLARNRSKVPNWSYAGPTAFLRGKTSITAACHTSRASPKDCSTQK